MDFARPPGLLPQVRYVVGSLNIAEAIQAGPNVVTCWAVLEHLPDPHLSARTLVGLTKKSF
jgi:2-polyprenyl-3-methyl-5-hydroxy-6-metoxy-1,4-benzoquinol methylase